jgi:hypothetical protein
VNEQVPMHAEQVYRAYGGTVRIFVLRVGKDGTWADIECTGATGDPWRKRQHLVDGRFPFDVEHAEVGSP